MCSHRASKVVRGGQKGVLLLHTKRKVSGKNRKKNHRDSKEQVEEEQEEEEEGPFFLDQEAESEKDVPRALWSGVPWRGVATEKKSNRRFHWSAQEMRTGVWASSFFWVSGKLRWPLEGDGEITRSIINSLTAFKQTGAFLKLERNNNREESFTLGPVKNDTFQCCKWYYVILKSFLWWINGFL